MQVAHTILRKDKTPVMYCSIMKQTKILIAVFHICSHVHEYEYHVTRQPLQEWLDKTDRVVGRASQPPLRKAESIQLYWHVCNC